MRRSLFWVSLVVLTTLLVSLVAGCAQQATPTPTTAPAQPQTAEPTKPTPASPVPTVEPTKPVATSTQPSAAAGPAVQRIQKAGKLVVLVDATFKPMEFKDEKGEIVGFDVDLAKEIAKGLGVQLELQNIAWDGIFAALKTAKGDMIVSSVTITDERKKEMAFSDPYYAAGQAILVRSDNTDIKGPEDLKGKVVAVQIDTTGQEAVEKIAGVKEVKKLDAGSEACIMTEQGKADATVIDIMVAGYFAKEHPKVKLVSRKPFTQEDLGIAMRKDDADLVQKVNELLAKMKSDGTIDKALEKWGMK